MATKVKDLTTPQPKKVNLLKKKWIKAKGWFKKEKPTTEIHLTAANSSPNHLPKETFDASPPINNSSWSWVFTNEEPASSPIATSPNEAINDLSEEPFHSLAPTSSPSTAPSSSEICDDKTSLSSSPAIIMTPDEMFKCDCDGIISEQLKENKNLKEENARLDTTVTNQRLAISNLRKQMANMITKDRHEEKMVEYVMGIISEHNANLKTYQLIDDGKNEYAKKEENLIAEHNREMNGRNNIISHQRMEISMLKNDAFSLSEIHNAKMAQRDRMISNLKDEIATLRSEIKTTAHANRNQTKESAKIQPKTPLRKLKSNCSKVMRQTKKTLWTNPIAQLNNRPMTDRTNEWEKYAY